MALSLTSAATTVFSGQVIQTFTQMAYFRNDMTVFQSEQHGGRTKRFPIYDQITAAPVDDGTDLSAGSSYSLGGKDATPYIPFKAYETIKYSDLETYEPYVLTELGYRLGLNLALLRSNTLACIIAKAAKSRADDAGVVEIPNAAAWGQAAAADYSTAITNGIAKLAEASVPLEEACLIVHPRAAAKLRTLPEFSSRDYYGQTMNELSPSNRDPIYGPTRPKWYYLGVEIIVANNKYFGTNATSNTDLVSDAQSNFSYVEGILFSKKALGLYEVESPNGRIDDLHYKSLWQLQSRTIFGCVAVQTPGMFYLANAH